MPRSAWPTRCTVTVADTEQSTVAPAVTSRLWAGLSCVPKLALIDKPFAITLQLIPACIQGARSWLSAKVSTPARTLPAKVPVVKGGYGYVLHSDHSIPNQVSYDSYRYFVDRGLELGVCV